MITGRLRKQLPKPSKPIDGTMTCHDKRLLWWDDPTTTMGRILAEIRNPEIMSASTHGIQFRGFEPSGIDKSGREVLKYQEWWITPNSLANAKSAGTDASEKTL
jgi:hypothetical protein